MGNALGVQWLELGIFTAVAWGSVPGWGVKIPQATWYSQKDTNKQPPPPHQTRQTNPLAVHLKE